MTTYVQIPMNKSARSLIKLFSSNRLTVLNFFRDNEDFAVQNRKEAFKDLGPEFVTLILGKVATTHENVGREDYLILNALRKSDEISLRRTHTNI